MQEENLIPAAEICSYHNIDISFISELEEIGLVETIEVRQTRYFRQDQLAQLEKLIRLHQELDIHAENLDIISYLLSRMESLEHQITQLKNRLGFYEHLEGDRP